MNDFWFGFCCGVLGASVLRAHVQACFDREEELITQVKAAATVEAALEAIKWPS